MEVIYLELTSVHMFTTQKASAVPHNIRIAPIIFVSSYALIDLP